MNLFFLVDWLPVDHTQREAAIVVCFTFLTLFVLILALAMIVVRDLVDISDELNELEEEQGDKRNDP